jgi:hypothetical protein
MSSLASSSRRPRPLGASFEWDRWALIGLVAATLCVLAALGMAATGASWFDTDEAAAERLAPPQWVTTETVRATTSTGQGVKAKVAIDLRDAQTREWFNSRRRQVALLMEISVSEHDGAGLTGSQRVRGLAKAMQERLDEVLAAAQLPPVQGLVIQDLVISAP